MLDGVDHVFTVDAFVRSPNSFWRLLCQTVKPELGETYSGSGLAGSMATA